MLKQNSQYLEIHSVLRNFIENQKFPKMEFEFVSPERLYEKWPTNGSRLGLAQGVFLWYGNEKRLILINKMRSSCFTLNGVIAHELTHYLQSYDQSRLIFNSRVYELEFEADRTAFLIGQELGFLHRQQDWLDKIVFPPSRLEFMMAKSKEYAEEILNVSGKP